jgi:hypothetical protein
VCQSNSSVLALTDVAELLDSLDLAAPLRRDHFTLFVYQISIAIFDDPWSN